MTQHGTYGGTRPPEPRGAFGFDPWYDELASGREGWLPVAPPPGGVPESRRNGPAYDEAGAIYLAVQRSPEFQEVRRRHRRFVFPATVAFLGWYLLYIVTATAAPELMARPVGAGPVNVGMLAGLGQFASTALLTWLYVNRARRRWDKEAFDLRWDTQLRTRGAAR
ncbi:DUF485 domain-containing protein [Streptomyces durbertensis]|uniref:DUF485 domain-containing protein n=1 Tax=Streptomyces durbertensis TaxID=2448886 RepID=A0ABR6ECY4_9ACTN|nr:DUF485 domain-containing protein [Streptomyces durbertensis]MBB1243189.1 DUF485 domain-containing protein [Streptomyces durbertensis]